MTDELVLTSPGEESIGPRLARHREGRGLTLEAAAARLHCDVAILRALETERFGEIGARVFVQGHLRRYAEFVGAPADELLAEWARRGAAQTDPDLTRVPRAPARVVDPQAWARRLGSLAAALVIAVAAWWILKGGGVATPVPSVPAAMPSAAVATPAVNMSTMVPPVAPAPVAAAPAAAAQVEAVPIAAVPSAAVPVASASVPAAATQVAGRRSIVLTAGAADSWVEVYDATGRRLYFDLVRRGSRATAEGAAPLRVLVGRADTMALEIDGRGVTIPAELLRNATAHFTIDSQARLARYLKPATTESATVAPIAAPATAQSSP
jgi:cytoskeleton protein RodZ